jgi:hypothetical protein
LLRPSLARARKPASLRLIAALAAAWFVVAALFTLYGLELGIWFCSALRPVVVLSTFTIWLSYDAPSRPLRGVP